MMFDVIPTNDETWVICGGRDFADLDMFDSAMNDLCHLRGCPRKIVSGHARGADQMGEMWANQKAAVLAIEQADWQQHGQTAGPIRNQIMLDKHKPNLVVAFPGGRGTADMVSRARKAGIDVAEIKAKAPVCSDSPEALDNKSI